MSNEIPPNYRFGAHPYENNYLNNNGEVNNDNDP
jgi:hypothetical protein